MKRFLSMLLSFFMLLSGMESVSIRVRAEENNGETEQPGIEVAETEERLQEKEPAEEIFVETEEEEEITVEDLPEEGVPAEESETEEEFAKSMEEEQVVTVTYDLPEGVTMEIDGQTVTGAYTYTVTDFDGEIRMPDSVPEKDGYIFKTWVVKANGYDQGSVEADEGVYLGYITDNEWHEFGYENIIVICVPQFNQMLTFSIAYHLNMEGAILGDSSEAVITHSYENIVENDFDFPRPYKEGKEYLG